ncbi:tRNA (N(6)-L-threonylcarbamoyladenosine(37)-C(2))-methylthiotransferase MtaB [Thermoactinomyces sp. DSM 45892]|uniref:tRNA (N(6)-L-threonylcarbamoyladenosine(37)-C(2))- methylthiotransferase MtaB n=1 Tax=Thermoactinomyces sp. DSM 45892 TaxID=1882753 RepID=UPI00089AE2BA|nr:tRNA (N(6)-L-threonylcarbamoyladenosine(37)-C(2))-methylthiotransferase MtaB [Thermoactinomyces sp. DSM 45892]SDY66627.1 threonylcarbamoyladenosine tRNA methylthiotransferase MtaB [Thermoactinomyces sp. DSM 45892]
MSRVAFHTLGCKVNSYETEAMWQLFQQAGYQKVDFEQEADVYLINTCTVTNTGDKKSRQMIRRAVRQNPDAVIAVTGCYAQTSSAEVAAIPGVDIVVGTQGRDQLVGYVDQFRQERLPINAVGNIMKQREYEELEVPTFSERTRASLKIQEGCNNFCTFCIIPWAKGLSRSRKPENVLVQAQQLVEAGYKEIVLTGIHTGGYGDDFEDYKLADLLWDLDRIEGLKRIRISSIEASQVNERVIEVLNASEKMCRHLHIPLQAGDNEVLKRMRRKYTVEEYRETIRRLHKAMPNLAITTDVIVGFPGETDEQFENGLRFVEELGMYQLHVFPYSKRTGTPAARMTDQVPENVKNERVRQFIELSKRLQLQYAKQFVGDVLEVIPERPYKEDPTGGLYMGYADNYLQVAFPATEEMVGKVCKVKIDRAESDYVFGSFVRIIDEVPRPAVLSN